MFLFAKQSRFERKLLKSTIFKNNDFLALEDLVSIISVFETEPQTYSQFFQLIARTKWTFNTKYKFFLLSHLILNEFGVGQKYAEHFINFKFAHLDQKDDTIMLQYYQYLQRVASSITLYHACKIQQYPMGMGDLVTSSKQLWLFKIYNLLNSALSQWQQIEIELQKNNSSKLLKEMMLVYWNDIITNYNFLSREIMELTDTWNLLDSHQLIQLNELINYNLKAKNQVLDIYHANKLFDRDRVIKHPKEFKADPFIKHCIEQKVFQALLELKNPTTQRERKEQNHNKRLFATSTSRYSKDSIVITNLPKTSRDYLSK